MVVVVGVVKDEEGRRWRRSSERGGGSEERDVVQGWRVKRILGDCSLHCCGSMVSSIRDF